MKLIKPKYGWKTSLEREVTTKNSLFFSSTTTPAIDWDVRLRLKRFLITPTNGFDSIALICSFFLIRLRFNTSYSNNIFLCSHIFKFYSMNRCYLIFLILFRLRKKIKRNFLFSLFVLKHTCSCPDKST